MKIIFTITLILFSSNLFAQETSTFKIQKQNPPADTLVFSLNNKIFGSDTLYKNELRNTFRLLASDPKIDVVYYELQCKIGKNKTVTFWRNTNIVDNEIKKYLRKVKSGNEVCITYVSATDNYGNAYKSNLCFIIK